MTGHRSYAAGTPEPLTVQAAPQVAEMFHLSPYVWREAEGYGLLLRTVNDSEVATEKVSRAHYGHSRDGVTFAVEDVPVLAAGPEMDDRDGSEDPTLVFDGDRLVVFYSGWNQDTGEGHLLRAVGRDVHQLAKAGRVLPEPNDFPFAKETSVVQDPDGSWRMFFEYARDGASLIGTATAAVLDGPWTFGPDVIAPRPDSWDAWHLSPGPILYWGSEAPVLIYNGATKDAHWRIGWAELSPDASTVTARCTDPLVVPGDVSGDATDIAFAASAVDTDQGFQLYYSLSDKTLMRVPVTVNDPG